MKNKTGPEIAKKALAATVYLEMKDHNEDKIYGSGFFVKPNLIATNYHVIAGITIDTAKVTGQDTTYKIESITATDQANDLALLKVTASGVNPLLLGDSDAIEIGETVYVTGNPMGLDGTFSNGIISRLHAGYTNDLLQMTAPISPGSSGGPVLNNAGEVIGVSVGGYRDMDAQNLNFAIHSNYLKRLLFQTETDKPEGDSHAVSAATYFWRGNTLRDLKLYDTAIGAYTEAIRLNPNFAFAYLGRGIAKAYLGKNFGAIGDYDEAIRLNPDEALAYYFRGRAKGCLGQHFGAINDYDEAIRIEPDYAEEVYLNRGVAKAELDQHFAAIEDYTKAIRLKPDFTEAYYNRGLAKAQFKRMWEAKQDIQTALRLAEQAGDADTKARAEGALRLIQ